MRENRHAVEVPNLWEGITDNAVKLFSLTRQLYLTCKEVSGDKWRHKIFGVHFDDLLHLQNVLKVSVESLILS